MTDEIPMASRSVKSNPFGKCICEANTLLPEVVSDALDRLVIDSGKSKQQYLRDLIQVHVMGVDSLLSIEKQYLEKFIVKGVGIGGVSK